MDHRVQARQTRPDYEYAKKKHRHRNCDMTLKQNDLRGDIPQQRSHIKHAGSKYKRHTAFTITKLIVKMTPETRA